MRVLLLALLLAASGARASAAVVVPETPAGRELVSFLESYNARRLDEERWKRWFSIYGPLEVKQVAASADTDLSVWAQGRVTRGWIKLRIVLEEAPPHKLDGIGVTTGYLPEMAFTPPEAPLTQDRLVQEATSYLDRLAAEDYFSGTVLIARNGKPILARAWGQASRRYGVPNGVETKYNLGSLTKVFTAVAVAKLVDQGKLRFDDTIATHLPGYASQIADRATIHQLLTHTSGTGRGAFHAQAFTDRQRRSVSDLLAMTIAPPDFEPGTSVLYSNEAWVILAAILEKAGGMDYDAFVRKNVYDPAGMKDSGAFEADQDTPGVATGYTRWRWHGDRDFTFEDGPRRSNDFMRALKGNPSCCGYSTAPDLLRFANALLGNRLLSAGMTKTLLAEHVWQPEYPGAAGREGYAYGFELFKMGEVLRIGKAGSIDGVSTRMDIYPSLGWTVIVLSNYDSIAHLIVADHLGTLVRAARP